MSSSSTPPPGEEGRLPLIDEHVVSTDAGADRLWAALLADLHRASLRNDALARLLGAEPAVGTRTFTGTPGDAVPGFRVVDAAPPERLLLAGQHRFSRYRLEFLVDDGHLRARTFAEFPGWSGRLYRGAVIGTGGHRVVTRNWIRRIVSSA